MRNGPDVDGDTSWAALVISVVGILVSGVVGPQLTARATWRANARQFRRDQEARRRDDLRAVLDEAARLLAPGATIVRRLHEAAAGGPPPPPDVLAWTSDVHVLGQRLRLRLAAGHEVVRAYDAVRDRLVELATARGAGPADDEVARFEHARAQFLDLARTALVRAVPDT